MEQIGSIEMNRGLIDHRRISRQQLADRLGTTYERVIKWEQEGCPCYDRKNAKRRTSKCIEFDIIEVLLWLRARAMERKNFLAGRRAELRNV